jgi:hypothetical protein
MSLTTQPFEFRYFAHQLQDWRDYQKAKNHSFVDQYTVADVKLFELQFQSIIRTLSNAPKAVSDKIKKFEVCLRHNQSISTTMVGGIEYSKIFANDNPLQFLVVLPYDKIAIRPFNKEQFVNIACEISFLAFDTVLALERNYQEMHNLDSFYLSPSFRDRKTECVEELLNYFVTNYEVTQLPVSYRGFV